MMLGSMDSMPDGQERQLSFCSGGSLVHKKKVQVAKRKRHSFHLMNILSKESYIDLSSSKAGGTASEFVSLVENLSMWKAKEDRSSEAATPNKEWNLCEHQAMSLLTIGSWDASDEKRAVNNNTDNMEENLCITDGSVVHKSLHKARIHGDATLVQKQQIQVESRYA